MMSCALKACFIAYLLGFCFPSYAEADSSVCTKDEARSAESNAGLSTTWEQLHHQCKLYSHCDDGAIAEGFSESVTQLLDKHWGTFRKLGALAKADPGFGDFILRHIDETAPAERLNRIAANAAKQCPKGLFNLCSQIKTAASQT